MKLRIALAALAAALLLASPAEAWQTERLKASEHLKRWNSPQKYGNKVHLKAEVRVNGKPIHSSEGPDVGCEVNFYHRDLIVNVRVCGRRRVPIRVRYVSLDGKEKFTFAYRRKR